MIFIKVFWVLRAVTYKLFFRRLGLLSYIGPPLYLSNMRCMSFGKMVRIYPCARIECHINSHLSLGNNVSIGQNLHLICSKKVSIGNDCIFSANVFISDCDHAFELSGVPYCSQPVTKMVTSIGQNCFLGFGAVILAGSKIGDNCIVGAHTVVRGEYPKDSMIVGCPARIVKRYDRVEDQWVSIL